MGKYRNQDEYRKVEREKLLVQFAKRLVANLHRSEIYGGSETTLPDGRIVNERGIRLTRWTSGQYTERVGGHLSAIVKVLPGLDAKRMRRALEADDCEHLRQLVPWDLAQYELPELFYDGHALCISVPWPEGLRVKSVPVGTLPQEVINANNRSGRWIAGPDSYGGYVTLRFGSEKTESNVVTHLLVGGTTGSGKNYLTRWIGYQLRARKATPERTLDGNALPIYHNAMPSQIVLIDGKYGDGLNGLNGIPGQVGPIALDMDQALNAMFWVWTEMRRRYLEKIEVEATGKKWSAPPIYVFISEFDKFTNNPAFAYMFTDAIFKMRAAEMFGIFDIQQPSAGMFSDDSKVAGAAKRQCDTVCLRTGDEYDTAAILPPKTGLQPYRTLITPGDAYVIVKGGIRKRVLMAHIPDNELRKVAVEPPALREWPEFDASQVEGFDPPNGPGRPAKVFTAQQIAVGIVAGDRDLNRQDTRALLKDKTGEGMSNSRIRELRDLCDEVAEELDVLDYCDRPSSNEDMSDLDEIAAVN